MLIITKDFMTASMKRANDEGAYFLTDSSTFIVERKNMPKLQKLFRGGPILANPYHTLYLTEPTSGAATAKKFGEYLASEKVQALLRDFGKQQHDGFQFFFFKLVIFDCLFVNNKCHIHVMSL
jgi:tungstate transport system substrate-binding protein